MVLKVGVLGDYSDSFIANTIKMLSPNNDSKIRLGCHTLEFVAHKYDNGGGLRLYCRY